MKYPSIESKIMLQVARGDSPDQIAERLGLPVVDVLRQIDQDADTRANRPDYEPTIEEIRQACEAIQSGWSERERQRRTVIHNPPAAIPENVCIESREHSI